MAAVVGFTDDEPYEQPERRVGRTGATTFHFMAEDMHHRVNAPRGVVQEQQSGKASKEEAADGVTPADPGDECRKAERHEEGNRLVVRLEHH